MMQCRRGPSEGTGRAPGTFFNYGIATFPPGLEVNSTSRCRPASCGTRACCRDPLADGHLATPSVLHKVIAGGALPYETPVYNAEYSRLAGGQISVAMARRLFDMDGPCLCEYARDSHAEAGHASGHARNAGLPIIRAPAARGSRAVFCTAERLLGRTISLVLAL
jgi:hypothetical protein